VNIALYCTVFSYLTLNNTMTLKSGLEVTQDHSNLPFKSLGAVSCSPSMVTMAVSLTVYEIFNIKVLRDLENWVRGCSRSLKLALFDKSHTTVCWSAIVNIALSGTVFELFDVE